MRVLGASNTPILPYRTGTLAYLTTWRAANACNSEASADFFLVSIPDYGEADFLKANELVANFLAGETLHLNGDIVKTAWTWPSSPTKYFTEDQWTQVFEELAGWMTPRRDADFPLTVYRGTIPKFKQGMAWTIDLDLACGFAGEWVHSYNEASGVPKPEVACVYATEVPTWSDILCDFDALGPGINGRDGEHEIVLSTALLETRRITVVKQVTQS